MANMGTGRDKLDGDADSQGPSSLPQDRFDTDITLQEQTAQLRRLNQELRDGEQRLRLAIETGRIGLWVWNSTDVANAGDWSPRLKEIFGLPPDTEVTHELFLRCVHPEDRERVDRAVMDALAGVSGGTYHVEYRIIHPDDGSLHWVTARAQAFFDDEGRPFRFIGTLMEITERKVFEESTLRMNAELERRIVARTADLERAIEDRRGSEHLARGQLEVMRRTLAAMSQESKPEKFLEHVLSTIGHQLDSDSVGVYELNPATGRVHLVADCCQGQLHLAPAARIQASEPLSIASSFHPVWTEFFHTGSRVVLGQIEPSTVRVRFADGDPETWVDWSSHQVESQASLMIQRRLYESGYVATLAVPMLVSGTVTGLISIRFKHRRGLRAEEIELTRALAHQAMLAIQLIHLSKQSRESAVMAERNRLARDIHDTLAQGFTGVIMQLEAVKGALAHGDKTAVAAHVERASDLARASLGEARRSVRALRPRSLEGSSLCVALEALFDRMTRGTGLHAEFHLLGNVPKLPADWEEGLLRIAQESLTNMIRHAKGKNFRAALVVSDEEIQFRLSDDGIGFQVHAEHEGFGLLGMKERADQMGAEFSIRSTPGEGTEIQITLPRPGTNAALSEGVYV